MKTLKPAVATLGLVGALLSPALAQRATQEQMGAYGGRQNFGTIHLQCNLGSFKCLPFDPAGKAEGRFDITFSGTILVSKLEGSVTVSEGLTKEFEGLDRVVYHGTGRAVVTGKWRGLQWFGKDMTGVWYGNGIINTIGEFDENLETGEFWYDDPERRQPWGSRMNTVLVPEQRFGVSPNVIPERRGSGGN